MYLCGIVQQRREINLKWEDSFLFLAECTMRSALQENNRVIRCWPSKLS